MSVAFLHRFLAPFIWFCVYTEQQLATQICERSIYGHDGIIALTGIYCCDEYSIFLCSFIKIKGVYIFYFFYKAAAA